MALYGVPLVSHELRRSETYCQAVDSLENLNKIIHDVLQRISGKVADEKSRISAIEERVSTAQAKVDALAGKTKAVTVFAPPKYPAKEKLDSILPLSGEGLAEYRVPKHIDYALDEPHDGDYVKPSVALPQMLLFGGLDTEPHVATGISLDGLGRLPRNIPSVASLLLFNTDDTPYQRYMALDNLLGQDRSDEAQMTSAELFAAPRTVAEGDTLPEAAMLDYTYAPKLEQLPDMALPAALPNLPGVADITWQASNDDGGIAPSQQEGGLGRAWEKEPRPAPAADGVSAASKSSSTAVTTSTASSATSAPAASASSTAATSSAPVASAAAPPPPPPPPPSASAPSAAAANDNDSAPAAAAPLPEVDGGRGDLLASIRQGKKLRKAADRKKEEDKAPAKHGGGATGDIFGDLMNALNRRRKGIAMKQGGGAGGGGGGGSAGKVISRPPPPKNDLLPTDADVDSDDWEV